MSGRMLESLAPPAGHVLVAIPKAVLILTATEYRRGILRGKWWNRQAKMKGRAQGGQPGLRCAPTGAMKTRRGDDESAVNPRIKYD
jgi:hypothetical protein